MAALEMVQESSLVEDASPYLRLVSVECTPAPSRQGLSLQARRASRARMLQRRRRTLVALALVVGLAILSWPGHAFGGTTATGLPGDLATSSVIASGTVYVVQPGDTLASIAAMVNPVSPLLARRALAHELGSSYVVPGEHILIP